MYYYHLWAVCVFSYLMPAVTMQNYPYWGDDKAKRLESSWILSKVTRWWTSLGCIPSALFLLYVYPPIAYVRILSFLILPIKSILLSTRYKYFQRLLTSRLQSNLSFWLQTWCGLVLDGSALFSHSTLHCPHCWATGPLCLYYTPFCFPWLSWMAPWHHSGFWVIFSEAMYSLNTWLLSATHVSVSFLY